MYIDVTVKKTGKKIRILESEFDKSLFIKSEKSNQKEDKTAKSTKEDKAVIDTKEDKQVKAITSKNFK